jgi:hypothetical protein
VKMKSPYGMSLLLCCTPVECDGGDDQLICWWGRFSTFNMIMTVFQQCSGMVNEDIT